MLVDLYHRMEDFQHNFGEQLEHTSSILRAGLEHWEVDEEKEQSEDEKLHEPLEKTVGNSNFLSKKVRQKFSKKLCRS